MNNKELALKTAEFLDEKKVKDICIIDINEKSGFADYFVIATVGSQRQLDSVSDLVEDKLAEDGILVKHVEGEPASGWILMDYGDIIINLFTEDQRNRYQIEKVWGDCNKLEFTPKCD